MNKQPPHASLPAPLLTRSPHRTLVPAHTAPTGQPTAFRATEIVTTLNLCWAYSTIRGSAMRPFSGLEAVAGGGSGCGGGWPDGGGRR